MHSSQDKLLQFDERTSSTVVHTSLWLKISGLYLQRLTPLPQGYNVQVSGLIYRLIGLTDGKKYPNNAILNFFQSTDQGLNASNASSQGIIGCTLTL